MQDVEDIRGLSRLCYNRRVQDQDIELVELLTEGSHKLMNGLPAAQIEGKEGDSSCAADAVG